MLLPGPNLRLLIVGSRWAEIGDSGATELATAQLAAWHDDAEVRVRARVGARDRARDTVEFRFG